MELAEFGAIPRVETVEANSRPLGVALVDEHRTNKFSDPNDIVALAAQVQKADEFIRANAGSKLRVIAEQIKFLQKQAKEALYVAKRDNDLHHAACNMVKKPGKIYYLYERPSGQRYFSMLSPEEWGASRPHPFVGAYKLEYDQSWTAHDDIAKREEEDALFDKILNARIAITDGEKSNIDNSSHSKKPYIEEV